MDGEKYNKSTQPKTPSKTQAQHILQVTKVGCQPQRRII
jgi:hypothetical protein